MASEKTQRIENKILSLGAREGKYTSKKDVKNADCSGYVYENTGAIDRMSGPIQRLPEAKRRIPSTAEPVLY